MARVGNQMTLGIWGVKSQIMHVEFHLALSMELEKMYPEGLSHGCLEACLMVALRLASWPKFQLGVLPKGYKEAHMDLSLISSLIPSHLSCFWLSSPCKLLPCIFLSQNSFQSQYTPQRSTRVWVYLAPTLAIASSPTPFTLAPVPTSDLLLIPHLAPEGFA